MTTTIEYLEGDEDDRRTGWWIVDRDGTGEAELTGPYCDRLEATRWEKETRADIDADWRWHNDWD